LIPKVAEGALHVYHQYTIRLVDLDRDIFASELAKQGIGSGVYYPIPNHRLPAYSRQQDLLQTEQAAKECLSLPVYPSLNENELERIVIAVNAITKAGS